MTPVTRIPLTFALTLVACSGSTARAPVDASPEATPEVSVACPVVAPMTGSACAQGSGPCTYGDEPWIACRGRAECTAGTWSVGLAACGLMPACPPGAMTGATCPTAGAACPLSRDTLCYCSTNAAFPMCDGVARWWCVAPPADTRCPRQLPQVGGTCTSEGLTCDYGRCAGNAWVTCRNGAWRLTDGPCPHCG